MGSKLCSCFSNSDKDGQVYMNIGKNESFCDLDCKDLIAQQITRAKSASSTYERILKDSNLLKKLTKLQAVVRRRLTLKFVPKLNRYFKIKKEQLRRRFDSVYSKEIFNSYSWHSFYDQSPTPKITGISRKIEILNKDFQYNGEVNMLSEKHGYGLLRESNGRKKEGTWKNDKLEGWGRVITAKGELYEGLFKNDKLNGKGKKVNEDNSTYIGDFIDGLKSGFGKEESKEHVYEGCFKSNMKNGKGKIYYKNKNENYAGEFKDNQITGIGFYTFVSGDTYEGAFLHSMKHGRGKYYSASGGIYEGDYRNNEKCGKGTYIWQDGRVFVGEFENDEANGEGILTLSNKNQFQVKFLKGVLVEKIKLASNKQNDRK